jgi:predicted phosphodiesterase
MRIQIASDLHLDVLESRCINVSPLDVAADADVLVLAGDIHCGTGAVDAFASWPVPVVYVAGNHEAYGLRFLGCCLWTDYELYGDRESSMEYARRHMSDHSAIWLTDKERFSPEHAVAEHKQAIDWLIRELAAPFDGRTVVVTHHGVSPDSIHPRYSDHPINAGFLSDLRNLLEQADLWIHGHVHDSFDYRHGQARVVANPRGYPITVEGGGAFEKIRWENNAFCATKVVEI